MRFVLGNLCIGCGALESPSQLLEFTNVRDEARHLCADCMCGIAEAMELADAAWNTYIQAWVKVVLNATVTAVVDTGGAT
jgi:hypothetical protein